MKTVPLCKPIPYGDTTLSKLELRAPEGRELRGISLRAINDMETDAILKLAARLSTTPIVDRQLDPLHAHDVAALGAEIAGFFALPENTPSPTTSDTPTPS